MNKRIFYVSKSDESKKVFISQYLKKHKVSNIFIICEGGRKDVFKDFGAFVIGFKDLNKSENWIRFVNDLKKDSLLIVDNVVKFMFFGDGKKKYIKELSQSINYKIMLDVVPFFTEPYEIFYPFWFLGKEILGYNNVSSFKGNHFEEKKDMSIGKAHDFDTLKGKIKDYYIQDYKCFFKERHLIQWEMTDSDIVRYNEKKENEVENFINPVKLYNSCSTAINLIETKFKKVGEVVDTLNNVCVVINSLGRYPKMFKSYMKNKDVKFLSIHSDINEFNKFENIVLAEMPIVKPHSWIYIESNLRDDQHLFQIDLINNKLETYFHTKIFNNETRSQFDSFFYSNNM